jgi:hypothetical protein
MKNKKSVMLIGVLGVLIVIYLLQQLGADKKSLSESMTDIFSDFNTSSINTISVYKQDFPDSGLHFTKKDGVWLIPSYFNIDAKEKDIDKLLTEIKSLQGEIRSTKAELFSDYDITDNKALHIELFGADSSGIAHMLVGKGVQQASKASFIRKLNSDTVYKANQNFLSRFAVWNAESSKKMPGKRWANMMVTSSFERDKIESFEITTKRKTYQFMKKQMIPQDTLAQSTFVWEQVKPKRGKILEDKDIQDIVDRLIGINAQEIVNTEVLSKYGLAKPKYYAKYTSSNGDITKISFGNTTDTTSASYYVSVNTKPFIYKVAKYNFESAFIDPFKKD